MEQQSQNQPQEQGQQGGECRCPVCGEMHHAEWGGKPWGPIKWRHMMRQGMGPWGGGWGMSAPWGGMAPCAPRMGPMGMGGITLGGVLLGLVIGLAVGHKRQHMLRHWM
jgi:hypothetical protein